MKAAQINDYGDASVVQINEVEIPKINDDQILVEVHASSLNPFDTSLRAGHMKDGIPLEFPYTLGGDIAGIITEIGSDVTGVAVGDKVYGKANAFGANSGAFAEYAATLPSAVNAIPEGIDFNQAASLPLAAGSAVQAINHHIKLQPGQKIFINGGAGAIGIHAIEIAKNIGAYVATTASSDATEYVKAAGADEVIDYESADFSEILHDYDAVFDTARTDLSKSLSIVKRGGTAVSMVGPYDEAKAQERGVTALAQSSNVTTELLSELTTLVESGVIKTHVDKIFSLDQIQEAFAYRESNSVRSKVVIAIK